MRSSQGVCLHSMRWHQGSAAAQVGASGMPRSRRCDHLVVRHGINQDRASRRLDPKSRTELHVIGPVVDAFANPQSGLRLAARHARQRDRHGLIARLTKLQDRHIERASDRSPIDTRQAHHYLRQGHDVSLPIRKDAWKVPNNSNRQAIVRAVNPHDRIHLCRTHTRRNEGPPGLRGFGHNHRLPGLANRRTNRRPVRGGDTGDQATAREHESSATSPTREGVRILNISCVPSGGGPRLGCLVPTGAFAGPRLARCVFATLAAGGRGRFITPTLSLPLMSRTARDHAHKFGFVNRKVPVLLPGVPGRGRADLSFCPSAGGWIRRRCSRSDRWPHSAFGSSST